MARIDEMTRDRFVAEVLGSPTPVVVDFYADWCGPCRAMAPVLQRFAEAIGESARVVKVNVDTQPALAQTYGVRSIPTLLLFHNGAPVDRAVGMVSPQRLSEMLAVTETQ
jgi:thioredoxin 1